MKKEKQKKPVNIIKSEKTLKVKYSGDKKNFSIPGVGKFHILKGEKFTITMINPKDWDEIRYIDGISKVSTLKVESKGKGVK